MSGKKLAKLTMLANRIRKIISFELGKEIDKDVFFVLSQAWDKEIF